MVRFTVTETLKVTVAVSEMEKKKVIGTVIEIMTETVTTALIETATRLVKAYIRQRKMKGQK